MNKVKDIHLPEIISFDWDTGNLTKSFKKHGVEPIESEQVFYNDPVYFCDEKHSQKEERYFAYGITDSGRKLFVVFTIRNNKIRIISARDQNQKERRAYEKAKIDTKI